jgi:hypothetical protein
MSDFTDLQDQAPEDGLDRRQMIKRAALVGGALVWATPVVQSIGGTAFATTGSPGGGGTGKGISELTVLINCSGTYTWAKYTPQSNGGNFVECKANINVGQSATDAVCDAAEVALKAAGGSSAASSGCVNGAYDPATGQLCVSAPANCTIVGWSVHDGAVGGSTHCFYNIGGQLYGWNGSGVGTIAAVPAGFTVSSSTTQVCVNKS